MENIASPRLLALKGDSKCRPSSSIWQTIGNVAVTAAVTTLVYSGVRSFLTMYSWKRSLRKYDNGEAVPGPIPLPLFGNMLALRTDYYKTLYEYVTEPVSVFWVMSTPFVVVNDSDGIARVLDNTGGLYLNQKRFGYHPEPLRRAVGKDKSQQMSESAECRADGDTLRVKLNKVINNSFEDIKVSMDKLMWTLVKESSDCSAGKRNALRCVCDSIIGLNLRMFFGLPAVERENETEFIAEMTDFANTEFMQRMISPLKVMYARVVSNVLDMIPLARELYSVIFKFIVAQDEINGLGWLHACVGKEYEIDSLGNLAGLLMASSRRMPHTAVWMLHLIAKDEDVRQKIKDELYGMGIFSASDLEYEDLDKMQFAEAVVKETLRLYPPFPLIRREAQEDDVLRGVIVPKGTSVYIEPWLVLRDPDFWSDPHTFKPARFLEYRNDIYNSGWVYVPFERRLQMCVGSQLSLTELKVLLATAALQHNIGTSGSAELLNIAYPPFGLLPHGVDLNVKKSNLSSDLSVLDKIAIEIRNIEEHIRHALHEGKTIVIASDRDDTLGDTPATMEDQFSVIGNKTIDHLKLIDDNSRGYVAIVTGRRPSEIRMEHNLRVYGTTGSYFVERGDEHGSTIVDLPSSFEDMSRELKKIAEGQPDYLSHDDTQNKISIRFKGNRGYEAALETITNDQEVHYQRHFVLKKYLTYYLIELLPHVCQKSAAIDDMYQKLNHPYFVYLGNGKNDVSAAKCIKNYYEGIVIKIGNDRVQELATHAAYFLPNVESSRLLLSKVCALFQTY